MSDNTEPDKEMATTNLIVAAATLAGAPEDGDDFKWVQRVTEISSSIAALTAQGHPVERSVRQLLNSRILVGTVLNIKKAGGDSSRARVELKTFVTKYNKDGIDRFVTDWITSANGLAMAKKIKSLKGHRVRVWIENEGKGDPKYNDGKGFRVIRHIEDLGMADEEND